MEKMRFPRPGLRSDYLHITDANGQLFAPNMGSAVTDTDVARPWVPAPTASEEEMHREKLFGRSARPPRRPPLLRRNAVPDVPRAPDATVFATAVNVIVNDASLIVASTVVPQGVESTVSLEIGAFTDPHEPTFSSSHLTTSVVQGASGSSQILMSTPPPSPAPSESSFTTAPNIALSQGLNSTSTQYPPGSTTTITKTSTLNVSYLNGTLVSSYETVTATDSNTLTAAASSTGASIGPSSLATVTTPGPPPSGSSAPGNNGAGSATVGPTGGVGAAGSGDPGGDSAPSATSTSFSTSNSSPSTSPSTPTVVGGVVGGVAGFAIVLILLLTLLRMYRKRLKARGQLPEQIAARTVPSTAGGDARPATGMSQRSSAAPFPAALSSPFRKFRPGSSQREANIAAAHTASTEPERRFQRIAGRKIAPVLQSGGDPYGGNYGAFEKETRAGPSSVGDGAAATLGTTSEAVRLAPGNPRPRSPGDISTLGGGRDLAGSTFYSDSRGFYGGPDGSGRHTPTESVAPPPLPFASDTRGVARASMIESEPGSGREVSPEGRAVIRPSPARTPVTSSPNPSNTQLPIQGVDRLNITMPEDAPPTPALPPHVGRVIGSPGPTRDGVGRSLASQDGSRAGRFTEGV